MNKFLHKGIFINFIIITIMLVSSFLDAQCPSFTLGSLTADCIIPGPPCVMCGYGKTISLKVSGINLPVNGCVQWYYSKVSGFNPYNGQGTYIGCANINATNVDEITFETIESMCNNGNYYVVGIVEPLSSSCPQVFTEEFSFLVSCPNASIDTISRPCYHWPLNLTAPSGAIGYHWSGPDNFSSNLQNPIIPQMNQINSGTYYLTVTDSHSCTSVDSLLTIMPVHPSIILDPTYYNGPILICPGQVLTATVYGFPSVTGAWDFVGWYYLNTMTFISNDPSMVINVGDFWSIECEDPIYQCEFFFVEDPLWADSLMIKLTEDPGTLCYDDSLIIIAIASNGVVPYTYLWSNGDNSESIEVFNPGTYTVTATDKNGCTGSALAKISQNPEIKLSIFPDTAILCLNGFINLKAIVKGGSGSNYTYKWKTPLNGISTGTVITAVEPGTYSVTVTDGVFCTRVGSIDVTLSPEIIVDISPDPAEICPLDSIKLYSNISGGVGSFSYKWDTPTGKYKTKNITAKEYGLYQITVTDGFGCTAIDDIELATKDDIPVVILPNPAVYCVGDKIKLTASSTELNIQKYEWDTPNGAKLSDNIFADKPGLYSVTVTNKTGCTGKTSIMVIENPEPGVTILPDDAVFCPGGKVLLTASSLDTSIKSFNWITPYGAFDSISFNTSVEGKYKVSIINSFGCISIDSVAVSQSPDVNISISPDSGSFCPGGSIQLTASSTSTSPLTYIWSTPSGNLTGNIIKASIEGNYIVTATNSYGCINSDTSNIIQNSVIAVSISPDPSSICPGNTINLSAYCNASGILTYNWSTPFGPKSGSDILASILGNYSVTVTSSLGCTGTAIITVSSGTEIPLTITPQSPGLCNGKSVDLTANASGNNLTFAWFTPFGNVSGQTINATKPGNYSVTVTDLGGCTGIATIIVEEYPPLELSINPDPASFCNSGSVILSIILKNGIAPFSYDWNTPGGVGASSTFDANVAGNYSVTVTDVNGCTGIANTQVKQSNSLNLNFAPIAPGFCPGKSLNLSVIASGGQAPYEYSWVTPIGNQNVQSFNTGTEGVFLVTVTDINGCIGNGSITVEEYMEPAISLAPYFGFCKNTEVLIEAKVKDVQLPLNYSWVTPYGNEYDSSFITNTPGNYVLNVTNAKGCISNAITNIEEWPLPVINYKPFPVEFCKANPIDISAFSTAGQSPFTYQWQGPSGTSNANPLSISLMGKYSLTITDAHACSADTTLKATELPGLNISLFTDPGLLCNVPQYKIGSNVSGGQLPYTYIWNTPSGMQTISTITTSDFGLFSVTVTDIIGCTGTAFLTETDQSLNVILDKSDPGCISIKSGAINLLSATNPVYPLQLVVNNSEPIFIHALPYTLESLTAGSYQIIVTSANGCQKTFLLELLAASLPKLDLGEDVTIFLGESYTINPTANFTVDSIKWTNKSSLVCTPACVEPIATPKVSTTYKATAYSKDGCKATDDINIYVVEKESVYIPNSFSPNGDGINDQWLVFTDQTVKQIKKMYIYDRWGEAIFLQENFPPNDPAYGWNGKFRNQLMNDAVFVFYVQVEFNDGRVKEYKGDVNLLK